MEDLLFEYYLTLFEALVILFVVFGVGGILCWEMRRRWRSRLRQLERELEGDRIKHEEAHLQESYQLLHSVIAHEFVKGLDHISKMGVETIEGLGEDQHILRGKQDRIIIEAHELAQHAENVLDVFAPGLGKMQKELVNIRRLVEHVLLERFPYAQSRGVTLLPNLVDVEPAILDRNLSLLALKNVLDNAIRYSYPGGSVEISISLKKGAGGESQAVCVEVKDRGKGIQKEDQNGIFQLRERGDGVIEPGSGLGLYCAREAARRQGGDVVLVKSGLNEGSIFRILFPYRDG